MLILLICYFMFLFAYFAFNVYGIFRVSTMRIKDDATGKAILIYVLAIAAIIFFSLVLIIALPWPSNFGKIL